MSRDGATVHSIAVASGTGGLVSLRQLVNTKFSRTKASYAEQGAGMLMA